MVGLLDGDADFWLLVGWDGMGWHGMVWDVAFSVLIFEGCML